MGLYPGGTNYNGILDEVQLWNISQPQSWIQSNLDRGLIGSESGLLSYYRFDEGSGTLTQDAAPASQNNEGVLVNGPTWVPGLILLPGVVTQPASLGLNGAPPPITETSPPSNPPATVRPM
jgi:hypothetical protein